MAREKISDVFKSIGQPLVTYVKRDSGKLESHLRHAIGESGQLCLMTGPSKTGKTTLYREVLSGLDLVPLVVPCDKRTTVDQIWKAALEAVDFDRVETRTAASTLRVGGEAELSGKLGWKWLAEAASRFKGTLSRDIADTEARKAILSEPGPDLLIPVLRRTNYILVIEDFHYLDDAEKVLLFQQWKRFIDNEVSVLVLGTTHRAVDIANSNKDLVGRIAQIDVGHWEKDDLTEICRKGFDYLGASLSSALMEMIATEAVGLPIIVQQVCYNIFVRIGVEYVDQVSATPLRRMTTGSVEGCLNEVARTKYAQFEAYYNTLVRGPREKARKYKTYELVIACFTLDPIKFSLPRNELDERLVGLVSRDERPPAASLNSTLGALKKFQERREFTLLEWIQNEEILYIVEPSFLFYVRWRTRRTGKIIQLDLFEELLAGITRVNVKQ